MLHNGTVIRYIGNTKARKFAQEKNIFDWQPDNLEWDFGVIDGMKILLSGIIMYNCRILVKNAYMTTINRNNITYPVETCRHFSYYFYDFEVEEV